METTNEKQVQLKDGVPNEDKSIVMMGNPEEQLAFGQRASKALMAVVSQKKKPVLINGEQYLEFEDWQTLGRFFGASVVVEWTKPVMRKVKDTEGIFGYEARANVVWQDKVISSAEAMCMKSEKNWINRPEFMLRSMAQTRACAKALRNVFAWVAVLAGFRPTPAEEMDEVVNKPKKVSEAEIPVID